MHSQRSATTPTSWLMPASTAALALACCAVVSATDPQRSGALPPCPFRVLTGWACPVCGSTRMLQALLHGDVSSAARYNVVVLAVLPALLYAWLRWTAQAFGHRLPAWQPAARTWRIALGAWLAFAVLRNLPWAPVQGLRV